MFKVIQLLHVLIYNVYEHDECYFQNSFFKTSFVINMTQKASHIDLSSTCSFIYAPSVISF